MRRSPLVIPSQSAFEVRSLDRFDERIDTFCIEAATAFDLIQARDQGYLNWRYADDRAGQFTIRIAEDAGGRLLGYLVLRTGRATTDLADLLALPGRTDVAQALVRDAVGLSRATGASAVRSWTMRGHPYEALLA